MEDNFDKYLKRELDSISDNPISSLWNKEKTWNKIASGLNSQSKTVSIKWLYATASIILLLILGSSIFYRNYKSNMQQMESENIRLLTVINSIPKQLDKKSSLTDTIFRSKEFIKKVIVTNTVYVHDTATVLSYFSDTVSKNQNIITSKTIVDTAGTSFTNVSPKKNKLKFVMTNELIEMRNDNRRLIVSSKSILQSQQDLATTDDKTLKIEFN